MKQSAEPAAPPGRALVAPWFVASVAILFSFALTRLWRQGRLDDLFGRGESPQQAPLYSAEIDVWQGLIELESGEELSCILAPFSDQHEFQSFRSSRLAKLWGLPQGSLMRLLLQRGAGDDAPLSCTSFEVFDAAGSCLQVLAGLLPEDWEEDSFLTLIARRGAILDAGEGGQIAGWGRAPGPQPRLILETSLGTLELPLEKQRIPGASLPRSFAEQSSVSLNGETRALGYDDETLLPNEELEPDPLQERILDLEAELLEMRQRVQELETARVEREEEILRFNGLLASLPLPSELRAELGFEAAPAVEPAPRPDLEAEAPDPGLLRAEQTKLALRTLLTLEGLYTLDLLEVGELHDPLPASLGLDENGEPVQLAAEAGWVGPVLFRLLDSFGRLNGSLRAERLHLEGSRASRTLHIVLSDGYESHQGVRTPFASGVRRISLPLVDPERWIDRLPELFSPRELAPSNDDGLWQLAPLRLELNELLGQSSSSGWYRFHGFGGVLGDELIEVQLQQFDSSGRLRRRLFADRLRIVIDERGVSLQLTGGAIEESGSMTPFRDGSHSIFLPAALPENWRARKLPGVAPSSPEIGTEEEAQQDS